MPRDFARYHRQMLLPGFGPEGQRRLAESTAFVLGCGALGSFAADLLARAGVGRLVIADRDFIELTNLQRQTLFDERDVAEGMPKAEAARRRLGQINSEVEVTAIVDDVNHANIEHHAAGADVIVDGLDNFETRYLANDLAVHQGIPYLYGGAVGTAGMAYAILPHTQGGDAWWETLEGGSRATPCYRCIFEEPPPPGENPTCDTVGVVASAVAIVASFQVTEALKILTRNVDRVCPTMLSIDLWANSVLQLKVAGTRDAADCRCCRHHDFEYLAGKAGSSAAALCGRNAVQLRHRQQSDSPDLREVAARLRQHGDVRVNEFMVRAAVREGDREYELTLFADGRAIVKGTDEASVARGVYAKYVGG